jgi:hypothetical protein
MLELAALATTVVTQFLVPLVKQGAEKLAEGVASRAGEEVGEQAAGVAQRLWKRVTEAFAGDPDDETSLDLFQKKPETYAQAIEDLLRSKLEEDRGFADELQKLVDQPTPDGGQVMTIMGDYVGNVFAPQAVVKGRGTMAGLVIQGRPDQRSDPPDQPSDGT